MEKLRFDITPSRKLVFHTSTIQSNIMNSSPRVACSRVHRHCRLRGLRCCVATESCSSCDSLRKTIRYDGRSVTYGTVGYNADSLWEISEKSCLTVHARNMSVLFRAYTHSYIITGMISLLDKLVSFDVCIWRFYQQFFSVEDESRRM